MDRKHRWMMYLTGVLLGSGVAWMLVSRRVAEGRTPGVPTPVVLTACELRPGDALSRACAEVRSVSSRRVPPGVIPVADLDSYWGRTLSAKLVKGSALRVADFSPKK
jgi:hypothetical protein